nr:immunoglobulin heavy chain junction region [Macaca mulatta]MOV41362.1 immunoglobulin heavy chain junction region [Macaca mulatta]MOV46958.1 immunoglobulin heavy chain junction region [Macaca mulatta]
CATGTTYYYGSRLDSW